jgi:hypothetical protein
MRQLAGLVLAAAVVAAAIYLTVDFLFFDQYGEARPDHSIQSFLLIGLAVAALLALVLGVGEEVRRLLSRLRGGGRGTRPPAHGAR